MKKYNDFYIAKLAPNSTIPTLLCGHCQSILSPKRIITNEDKDPRTPSCNIIGLCSADDCGAVNCCDEAMAAADQERYENRVAV